MRKISVALLLLAACAHPASRCPELLGPRIEPNWLLRRVTVDEAEREHMVNRVPFGFQNQQWKELRSAMRPGDELWLYSRRYPPPPPSAIVVGGEVGYVLIRDCNIIDSIVVLVS